MSDTITINRAPVLTLWAAVVAERLGLNRAPPSWRLGMAGSSVYPKGVSLGTMELKAFSGTPPPPRPPPRQSAPPAMG